MVIILARDGAAVMAAAIAANRRSCFLFWLFPFKRDNKAPTVFVSRGFGTVLYGGRTQDLPIGGRDFPQQPFAPEGNRRYFWMHFVGVVFMPPKSS